MMHDLCLAVDIGTSSVKAGLIDSSGVLHAFGRSDICYPDDSYAALTPAHVYQSVREAIGQLPGRLQAAVLAISGNGPSLIPVDLKGNDLGMVLLWLDGRELRLEKTSSFFLPKLQWFRQHKPDLFGRTHRVLSCAEYVMFCFCGEMHTASPSVDFDEYFWNQQDLAEYSLDAELFPDFARPGALVGHLKDDVAAELGLSKGLSCAATGSDFLMSLLGTATIKPGMVCDRAGSSEGINYCTSHPVKDGMLRTLPHIIPGLWNVSGILSSTGLLFEWFRRFTGMQDVSYLQMLQVISDARPPVPWFFPSLHRGASWEFRHGMFFGLGASHGTAEMGRAVVESIGFAVRETLEILRKSVGPVESVRACGGQTRNPVWNQMKADIIGVPLEIPEIPEAELLGGAVCGFACLAGQGSLPEIAESIVRIASVYEPCQAQHKEYSLEYENYSAAYQAVREAIATVPDSTFQTCRSFV